MSERERERECVCVCVCVCVIFKGISLTARFHRNNQSSIVPISQNFVQRGLARLNMYTPGRDALQEKQQSHLQQRVFPHSQRSAAPRISHGSFDRELTACFPIPLEARGVYV